MIQVDNDSVLKSNKRFSFFRTNGHSRRKKSWIRSLYPNGVQIVNSDTSGTHKFYLPLSLPTCPGLRLDETLCWKVLTVQVRNQVERQLLYCIQLQVNDTLSLTRSGTSVFLSFWWELAKFTRKIFSNVPRLSDRSVGDEDITPGNGRGGETRCHRPQKKFPNGLPVCESPI